MFALCYFELITEEHKTRRNDFAKSRKRRH